MSQYYANFNEVGNIVGFYLDEIHGESIPVTAKPITVEEWRTYSDDANLYKLDGEVVRLKTQAELDAEYVTPEPLPKTPDQLRIEQLEAENASNNAAIIELWETILGSA